MIDSIRCFLYLLLLYVSVVNCRGQFSAMPPSPVNHPANQMSSEHKYKEPPHGGTITEAGKYHIEVFLDPIQAEEKLSAWVLNSNYKTKILKNASAKVKINYENKESIDVEMTFYEDRFYCNIPDVNTPFNAVITVTEKNKTYTATYFYKGLNKK